LCFAAHFSTRCEDTPSVDFIVSFADGHSEYHKWLEPTTSPPLIPGQRLPGGSKPPSPDDRNMQWLVAHTTGKE
jgi:hypothetical protein